MQGVAEVAGVGCNSGLAGASHQVCWLLMEMGLGSQHTSVQFNHTCRHRQKGLVDGVNVHVVDLVDAHDVAVAAQQAQDAQQSARQ